MSTSWGGNKKFQLGGKVLSSDLDPEQTLIAIFKVLESGYVPTGVEIRSRIDAHMFTGSFRAKSLPKLEQDGKIKSAAISEDLRLID